MGRDSDSLGLPNFVSGDVGHLRQSQAVRLSTWRAEDAGADQGDAGRWNGLDEIADALNAEGVKTRSGVLSARPPKSMSSRAASRHHRTCQRQADDRVRLARGRGYAVILPTGKPVLTLRKSPPGMSRFSRFGAACRLVDPQHPFVCFSIPGNTKWSRRRREAFALWAAFGPIGAGR